MDAAKVRVRVKGTRLYADAFAAPVGSSPSYDAAGYGRRGRMWRPSSIGPNAVLQHAQPELIRRSRDAIRQNGYADHAATLVTSNIVGTGIVPQFATTDKGLNAELTQLWLDWTDEADADGRCDFYGLQRLAVREMFEAGETFARFRVRRRGDMDTVPLQLQVLESEFCPLDQAIVSPTGNPVRQGIEVDAIGRRTAYWLYRAHPYDLVEYRDALGASMATAVPASEVLHLYEMRRAGAMRGEPWLTRGLIKLRDVDQYDDAEVVRKKTAAMMAGFITQPSIDQDADDAVGIMGEGAPDDYGAAIAGMEPGTMQVLQPGEDVRFNEPADVGGQYEAFMRQQFRAVAVAAGVLYEQLSGDMTQVNDRTMRVALNEFRRRCEAWQHHTVVFQFCRPVHRRWLALAEMAGAIRRPRGMSDRDFFRAKWVPQRWPYIHPEQDINALIKENQAGLASRSQQVSERGFDSEAMDEEIARDNERADRLGLRFVSDGRYAAKMPAGPADQQQNQEGGR